jgi:hypothetical protein
MPGPKQKAHIPGSTRRTLSRGFSQVFWLVSSEGLTPSTAASTFPGISDEWYFGSCLLTYSGGTAPAFHRIPCCSLVATRSC